MSPGSLELRPGQTVNHPDLGDGVLVATETTGPSNPGPDRGGVTAAEAPVTTLNTCGLVVPVKSASWDVASG